MSDEKKLYIERVTLTEGGSFLSSTVELASEDQIKEFKSKACNHDMNVDKLIYDSEGYPYDMRHCGICNNFLGFI